MGVGAVGAIGSVAYDPYIYNTRQVSSASLNAVDRISDDATKGGVDFSGVQAAEEQGVTVVFKGNELYYYFDLSKVEGYTEELAKSESIIAALERALIDGKQTFGEVSRDLEKATGIR